MALELIGNPRGRRRHRRAHKRTGRRSHRRFYRNPRMGGIGNIAGIILPIGLGVASGLAIPKFFNVTNKMTQYIIQAGLGLGIPLILGGVIGRKPAVLFGAGVLSAVVIGLVDDLVLKQQGKNVLSDTGDEVRVLTAEPDMSADTFSDTGLEADVFNDETSDEMSDDIL